MGKIPGIDYPSEIFRKIMVLKSERLKKLEAELEDLERWLQLGLVPKKDLERHHQEMAHVKEKIQEEKERLRFMKESGEMEEFTAPKRTPQRPAYAEPQTLPDMDINMETDAGIDMETESYDFETTEEETSAGEEEEGNLIEEEEEPFSDRNRWKRGILEDLDSES